MAAFLYNKLVMKTVVYLFIGHSEPVRTLAWESP